MIDRNISLAAPGWAGLCLVLAAPAWSSSRIDLDRDWQFRADPELTGVAAGWNSKIPSGTQSIDVPHTWNIGPLHDYLGVAWYFHRFTMPGQLPGAHVELHFGATFYNSRVWLNGVELGGHEGGFTAYAFDITQSVRAQNVIAVRIDNRPGVATIPGFAERGMPQARYDWWTYGGIVRDVWLTTSAAAWVASQTVRTSPSDGGAIVHDRITLERALAPGAKPARHTTVHVTAFDPDGRAAASETRAVALRSGTTELAVSLRLEHPDLWSTDHPNLYRMVVELEGPDHEILDQRSDAFGVRSVEIRERHLLLNGERVRLTGLARHEDSPWEGLAETRGTIWHDYDDMRALHTTLTRPVHYPQNPAVLDYADRHGILLIPEIPVWQFSEAQLKDPRVLALAQRQMREMIEEAGNHPSIFAWSVANESAMNTPGGIAYFRAMRDMIRKLDPQRFVSFTDDKLPKLERPDESAANDADFVMMNQYYGSWHGPAEALGPALDRIDQLFPGKMTIISEMGFAGIFAEDPMEADRMRIKTMRDQMPVLAARDWIAGAILWCYQDYKSPRNLWPGLREGYVEHGLVDESRQRKASYGVWRKLTEPAAIDLHWVNAPGQAPTGVMLRVTPNTQRSLPFYPLHDYRLTWRVTDENGGERGGGERRFADLSEPAQMTGDLHPVAPSSGAPQVGESPTSVRQPAEHWWRLTAELESPTGEAVAEEVLEWPQRPAQ